MKSQVIFSGVQPSGNLHIGNYLGAIKQFVELQKDNEAIFCVVDLHAITVPQKPEELHKNTLDLVAIYLAAGIDPKKSILFLQSHVSAHTELGWILNTLTPFGELMRMTQFKEKEPIKFDFEDVKVLKMGLKRIDQNLSAISVSGIQNTLKAVSSDIEPIVDLSEKRRAALAGLFNYPTLMAADILLYKTDAVPVGEDQLQHIEFTRMIAEKFNKRYGETFVIPKALVKKDSARIMGLDDPSKKMSKSAESGNNYIALLDPPDEIRRKIKIAVTDSGKDLRFDPTSKPAVSNLMAIYSTFSDLPYPKIEDHYKGKGYTEFKNDLAELIVEKLSPIRQKYLELSKNEKKICALLKNGAKKASAIAEKTLSDVKKKVGLLV